MRCSARYLLVSVICLSHLATAAAMAASATKRIPDAAGETAAVVVPADAALLHMSQRFHTDPAALLETMNLAAYDVAKLNVVAASPAAAEQARQAVRDAFKADARPAVSVVIGALPEADATVGIDAVIVTQKGSLPPGPRVYVSGQAEKADSPAAAAAKTIESLKETLKFVGCTPRDVVQAKCFLTPMSAAPHVVAEFERAFGPHRVPLVFVEWRSDLPIEIELVAAAPAAAADAPAVEYLTPPGKTASPVYARVVRVNRGDLVYIGDIASEKPGTGAEQVTSIFKQLQAILKQTGGDLRHLVKATYYVSDADASKQLNVLRPKYYDPARPPAASKAMVPAVGVEGRSITIDMIAVPAP